jgi:hypothetical protein
MCSTFSDECQAFLCLADDLVSTESRICFEYHTLTRWLKPRHTK